ncbi:hypothetical protein [Geothrix sp. PMB-07]|uniref:hypothetical protein n=1 Tax=Geothrix sp. PMB-07 TaxID=3068640 RepID=UPI00274255C7|nr:hypothetical protein [Geothrix sp. PMB-07]WLT31958.1 hypothetical protein Q9293_01250 [Geothrix sp. PMB-07]
MGKSIVTLFAIFALLACHSDKPEDQVKRRFEACRAAVEKGDAATASEALDAAFRGPEGMDKATARLFLMGMLRQEKVGVTVVDNRVTVRGNQAFQEVDLILTGRSGGLLPQDASHRSFSLRWARSGSDWNLVELQSLDGR